MDAPFYQDTRAPFIIADIASVSLLTTAKAMYPVANFPNLGSNYWWAGKKVRIEMFGRITTGATPGNGQFDIYWGNGTDANGTIIQSSAAFALIATQSAMAWRMILDIHCRTPGAAGGLFLSGQWIPNPAVFASVVLIPASSPAVSASLDLTLANIISVQFKRSGSTSESIQVHDMIYSAMN
jgi:hypothetical protein